MVLFYHKKGAMKIIFVGLPYFGEKLVADLQQYDPKNKYLFLNTYYSKKDQVKFLLHAPFAQLIVSFNGAYQKSKALDYALFFKKKIYMQWHGSDVLMATKLTKNNKILLKYIATAKSYTDATWLQEELKLIDIHAKLLPFKSLKPISITSQYPEISILTYLGKGKEVFYGWEMILEAIRSFPNIQLYVMGTDGEGLEQLSNITFLGWLKEDEVVEYYKKCPIFVRMTEHDGYSLSIMEALSYGVEVIWNNPHEKTYFADNTNELKDSIRQLADKITSRNLQSNLENQIWIKENLDRDKVLKNYIETITK
jgi:glycosyltransferase involved in cell wall biosynthesis